MNVYKNHEIIIYRKRYTFDPSQHRAPKYDIYGLPLKEKVVLATEFNNGINSDKVKLPNTWMGPNPGKTRTQLMHEHRSEFIPDPSYDIDGDGIVGGRDLAIAKIFDQDRDGKLNKIEKSNAMEAVKNGLEKNYMWGVEASGPNRSFRVLQKRGKICDADDFGEIKETYPEFPVPKNTSFNKTITEMAVNRKQNDRKKLQNDKIEWDKKNPSSVSRPFITSEYFVANPKHTSMKQIKNELKFEARKNAGLKPVADFSVSDKPLPSLKYLETPNAVNKQHLVELRQRANQTELKRLEKKTGITDIGIDRLKRKEECMFRMGKVDNRKTNDILVQNLKSEMLENNMRVFGNVSIGIHGKELPKYNESMKQWWVNKRGFNGSPKETSLLRFKQNMKYWAKKEDYILSDVRETQPKADDFKNTHVQQKRKNLISTSPNKINRISNQKKGVFGTSQKQKRDYRWTSLENQFVDRNNKYSAEVDQTRAERGDYDPLYSSFNPNGTFQPPPTVTEKLNYQKEQLHKTSISGSNTNKSKGIRVTMGVTAEESLMASGNVSTNLFARMGTTEGSPMKKADNSFRMTMTKGIRSAAFKNL